MRKITRLALGLVRYSLNKIQQELLPSRVSFLSGLETDLLRKESFIQEINELGKYYFEVISKIKYPNGKNIELEVHHREDNQIIIRPKFDFDPTMILAPQYYDHHFKLPAETKEIANQYNCDINFECLEHLPVSDQYWEIKTAILETIKCCSEIVEKFYIE